MKTSRKGRQLYIGAAILALVIALGIGQAVLQRRVDAQARTVEAPKFEVDPLWPKPLPSHWLLGSTILCDSCGCLWLVPAAQKQDSYLCRQCGSEATNKPAPAAEQPNKRSNH